MKTRLLLGLFFLIASTTSQAQKTNQIWLDDLDIPSFSDGIPGVSTKACASGEPIQLGGVKYSRGLGISQIGLMVFQLDGNATQFSAIVGADDNANKATETHFYILGDRKILFESGPMKVGGVPKKININLTGVKRFGILVKTEASSQKFYSDIANAQFTMLENTMPQPIANDGERYILTPAVAKTPRINSPKIFGAKPGSPFLFTVVATGEAPISYSADHLPNGLTIDSKTGIITGVLNKKGTYLVTMKANNNFGAAQKQLTIKIGDTISLTPPIGWNGWNSWARLIDREKVIASANAMVNMGLSKHGWTYINIDDGWQGYRTANNYALQPNKKFPDFKGMIDEIHSKGLKLGLYSTPWITSYAGFGGGSSNFEDGALPDSIINNKRSFRYIGKYRFEKQDAIQMAQWGVDYLKYDWRIELGSAERMSEALKKSGRDIIYSLSNSAPFNLVKDWARVSEAWRTGPDIRDSWLSLYVSAFTLDKWGPYGGPGHWNDPDMMILGNVTTGAKLHPTRLTPNEQYSHVSLFSLLAGPILIGCPIEQLDAFTLNLLSNDEVIEVNQDPLGKSARLFLEEQGVQVWLKPLEQGAYAVGIFNTADFGKTPASYFRWEDEQSANYNLYFNKLKLKGLFNVRNVWTQKEIAANAKSFKATVPHHGVVLLKLTPTK
ncbi:MAG: NPCBM/NEW2 domain-containing protein [Sediminibacterium sp.]|nr:NPCBM/NEW2 domain-containing protein [Sediminibacterium sp.]